MTMPYKTINRVSPEDAEHSSLEQGSLLQKIYSLRRFFRFFRSQRRVAAMIVVVLIVSGGYGVYEKYFYLTPAEKAKKELAAAVEAVSGLMILPEGDEPVLATVTDAKTLTAQQAFFAGAVNGDQLLLFPHNLKAVIYSPSRKMIVNVGPIQQQPAVAAGDSQPPISNSRTNSNNQIPNDLNKTVLTVEIRNGTGKTGLAEQTAQEIGKNGKFNVVNVTDAQKKNYSKTMLYTKTEDAEKLLLASELTSSIGATAISKMPAGEKSTDADALVILGGE